MWPAYAQSQEPHPNEGKHIKPPQAKAKSVYQESKEDKRGTDTSPIVIKMLDTPQSEARAEDAAKHQNEEAANSSRLVWITGILALAAILQWFVMIWQARQLKRSVDLQANSERAFLYTMVPNSNETLEKPGQQVTNSLKVKSIGDDDIVDQPRINYWIRNYGKSPAVVKEISHSLVWCYDLPNIPNYKPTEFVLDEQMIAASDSTKQISCNPAEILMAKATKDIIAGKSFFWFYGRVIYDDIFGKGHEHCFVWKYINSKKQFRPYYENKEYNKNT